MGQRNWIASAISTLTILALTGCNPSWIGRNPTGSYVSNSIGSVGMFAGSSNSFVTNHYMHVDVRKKTVVVEIVAGLNGGKNFNGYRNGDMTIAVPPGWTIRMVFQNQDKLQRHSLRIIPFHTQTADAKRAKSIVETNNAAEGIAIGEHQSLVMHADTPGRFAIVCGVPHVNAGMWDVLVISDHVPSPRIYTNFKAK